MNRPDNIQAAIDCLKISGTINVILGNHVTALDKKCLETILDYITSLEKAAEWQDIGTAPKDVSFLGCTERGHIRNFWWSPTLYRFSSMYAGEQPTHWRPLPTPPLSKVE